MATMAIRGNSLNVQVMGHGYPLALMHGGPGQDYTSLLPFQALADRFTLIFYDHRCNGQSMGPDISSMTWDNLTADADALRRALGFEKWAVLGHSFGGNVALEYALRYPQSLSHLILMNTGGDQWWVSNHAPRLLAKRGYSATAVRAAHRFFNGQITVDEYFPTVYTFLKAYFYRTSLKRLAKLGDSGPAITFRPEATIFGYSRLLPGWTVMDRLHEIATPALVVAGRHDFLFPPEHQGVLADRLPNAHLELIERAGHNPHMEQSAEVMKAVADFLAATPKKGRP